MLFHLATDLTHDRAFGFGLNYVAMEFVLLAESIAAPHRLIKVLERIGQSDEYMMVTVLILKLVYQLE